jgi:hypothetical protein
MRGMFLPSRRKGIVKLMLNGSERLFEELIGAYLLDDEFAGGTYV